MVKVSGRFCVEVQLAPLLQTHLAELVDGSSLKWLLEILQRDGLLQTARGMDRRDILRWCARLRKAQLVLSKALSSQFEKLVQEACDFVSPTFTEESRAVLLREALQVCCWAEWQTFGIAVRDTGTGKTSVVQHVGRLLGREVLVYNFNEQSESTELVGGFRPVDNVMQLMSELVESFCLTFEKSFSRRKNAKLLEKLRSDFLDRRWVRGPQAEAEIRGRRPCRPSQDWSFRDLTQAAVLNDVGSIVSKVTQASKGVKGTQLAFESVLDEINLAPSDLLQRIQGLIERAQMPQMRAHLALPESGNERVLWGPQSAQVCSSMQWTREVRLLQAAPVVSGAQSAPPGARAGQAAGKKVQTEQAAAFGSTLQISYQELPPGIRGRFTEIFVDEAGYGDEELLETVGTSVVCLERSAERQCLAKNADGDLKYEAVAPEVQRAQEVFANIPDVFELRGPMRFKSGDPLIDLLQCMRQGKKLPTPLSRKFQGRFAKDAEPGVPDPRFFEDKVRYGYCVSIYWGSLARMLSHCAVLDAKELQVPLVALQAADERCDLKQDGRCHFAPKICDADVYSVFLQIRSHLESTAGQMPLRTCDADEHSIFLQIRSHLESAAGQMPLRTCDADEHSIFLQIRSRLESTAGQMCSIFLQTRSNLESAAKQIPRKEQKGFGKFEKLKAYAEAIQEKWDLPKIKQYVLYGILLSDLAIFLLIYCLVLLIALPLHGYARAARLAWFQAVSNFTSLSIFEGLLLVGIHLLLHQVLLYSELLHSFVRGLLRY
ncbi:unnamed protein product [Durusdinium trenchii]|uniref:Uncharacterized protein n=1 Tax=Durusdinium trenchii TaxID=1381693 RepID=A0ABP0ND08_9DINO